MRSTLLQRPWFITVSALLCVALGGATAAWLSFPAPSPYRTRHVRLTQMLFDDAVASEFDPRMHPVSASDKHALATRLKGLLGHPDSEIQEAAVETLHDLASDARQTGAKIVGEQDLETLMDAHRRKLWVTPLIASIDTERAHRALVEMLLHEPEMRWDLDSRFSSLAAKTALVQVLRSDTPVGVDVAHAIGRCLKFGEAEDPSPASELLAIASDPTLHLANRLVAIESLGALGPRASPAAKGLAALGVREPEHFKTPVAHALLLIQTPEAVESRIARIESELARDDLSSIESILNELRGLAEIGEPAKAAGPLLIRLTRHWHEDIRNGAVIALGYVTYPEATAALLRALNDPDDWLLNKRAAIALARTGDRAALGPITAVARSHWHPGVRHAANRMLAESGGAPISPSLTSRQFHDAFYFDDFDLPDRDATSPPPAPDLGILLLRRGRGYLPGLTARQVGSAVEATTFVFRDARLRALSGPIETHCGLRAATGVFLGEDKGEFGAGLYHVDQAGSCTLLGLPNVQAVFHMPFGIVAVVGYAMSDDGALWLIDDSRPGPPNARWWKRLPFNPTGSHLGIGLLPNGDLRIRGVVLTTDGRLEWTPQMRAYLEKRYELADVQPVR